MDTNHIYPWTAISPWNQCYWLKSLGVNQISSLLTAPEWSLPIPNLPLWPIKTFFRVCPSMLLSSSTCPVSSWLPGKSNGRVLGRRRLLYACEKEQSVPTEGSSTTLLQNMYIPRLTSQLRILCSCRLIDYSILLKRKKKPEKKASHLSLSCSLSPLPSICHSQVCAGRRWTVLSELKWKKKKEK